MKFLQEQDSLVKKGRATIGRATDKAVVVPANSPIPIFEQIFIKDTDNVIVVNETNLLLKKGFKFALIGELNVVLASSSAILETTFYNYDDSVNLGISGLSLTIAETSASSYATSPYCEIITTKDTTIQLLNKVGTINQTQRKSKIIIEELEAYTIPIPRIDFDETVIKQQQQNIQIVPNLPVGYEKLIRKEFATAGVCNITFMDTNEKFTPSAISTISLNSDGDFWRIKKISATRWDLVDGLESGLGGAFTYYKYANKTCEILGRGHQFIFSSGQRRELELTIPINLVNFNIGGMIRLGTVNGDESKICSARKTATNKFIIVVQNLLGSTQDLIFDTQLDGEWY